MKNLSLYIVLIIFIYGSFCSCNSVVFNGRIEQETCGYAISGGSCKWLCTYVWWNSDIVWSTRDNTCTITDSIVKVRKEQAAVVLKALRATN